MKAHFFVTIDFDGTVTDTDITDAIIKKFAKPGWEETERLWEAGHIGSRECLSAQMSLINSPVDMLLDYAGSFGINKKFAGFVNFMKKSQIPFGIVSDGFQIFIERLLADSVIHGVPVYANRLTRENGGLKTLFPYANKQCSSGTCKCSIAEKLSGGLPVIHIGDGRSDFCLAEKAAYVFSKGKLAGHCNAMGIQHTAFDSFRDIEKSLGILLNKIDAHEKAYSYQNHREKEQIIWDYAS